jgi:cell division protein FtsW (lipid II flippase)
MHNKLLFKILKIDWRFKDWKMSLLFYSERTWNCNVVRTCVEIALFIILLFIKVPILVVGLLLVFVGILAIYSVSIYESFSLTLSLIAKWLMEWDASNYFYFFRQLRNIFMAIVIALLVYRVPIKIFQNNKTVNIIAIIILILQVAVFIPWIGVVLNWARWRLDIPGLPSIQPSEFFKLWYVIFLSNRLLRKKKIVDKKDFIISFLVLNAFLFAIFLMIPDLWTVLILGLTWLVMAWYAGLRFKKVFVILLSGLLGWLFVWTMASLISPRFSYIQKRFTYFINSNVDPQNRGVGRQNQQALMAIGWGWFWWKWYGKWLQKFWFIPEAQSDFIFAAFSEEIWFVWNMILIGLYFYLAFYFLKHLPKVRDDYSKVLGVGLISLIIIQAFINMWVNTKILPNTWLTLPFISYGGTAIMVNLIEVILLYKILKRDEYGRV